MKHFISLISFLLLVSCTGRTPNSTDIAEISNIIDLDSGLKNMQTVRLSEIADSVTFIPFETSSRRSLFGVSISGIRFSPSYIFNNNAYFDWNGNFCGRIGSRGNGPLEEPEGVYTVFFSDNHFYSKGGKFIEYDSTGKPTGKARNLYNSQYEGTFLYAEFFPAEDNFAVYDFPNTMYFVNKDFETVASRPVFEVDFNPTNYTSSSHRTNCFSTYKDHTLFYNFINDTIYYAQNAALEPKWIVRFNNPARLSTEAILNYRRLVGESRFVVGPFENSEWAKLMDNKHVVNAVYETDSYLFFRMTEIILLAERRGKKPSEPYIVCYEKATGTTFRIAGSGFVDDLLGLDDFFYPALGFYDEKIFTAVWPYELQDKIKESKAKGREVHPQLLALSQRIQPDDNPILIFVHLKK